MQQMLKITCLGVFHELHFSQDSRGAQLVAESKWRKLHFPHFAELERGERLIGKCWWAACLGLRSTADQSLAIYCLREDSLIDLNGLACKPLPAAVLDECMYWRMTCWLWHDMYSLRSTSLSTCAKCMSWCLCDRNCVECGCRAHTHH